MAIVLLVLGAVGVVGCSSMLWGLWAGGLAASLLVLALGADLARDLPAPAGEPQ